ncbi:HlyD family secretion protein [Rhizobium sp. SIMBA_035]
MDQQDNRAVQDVAAPVSARNPLRRVAVCVLVFLVFTFAVSVFMERRTPITAQATVNAYVVGIAPEVSGRVVDVAVSDNSPVAKGQMLFRIDPQQYELALAQAEAQLAKVGQSIGASIAALDGAQAKVVEARAVRDNALEQANRSEALLKRGVIAQTRADQARTTLQQAQAGAAAADAELASAEKELGPAGQDNPQLQDALAALERARLDLLRTTVLAPADGVVTNLQLSVGGFVNTGQSAITFIDAGTIWIAANFKENSLENVASGNKAEILFDALPGKLFPAHVESVGFGVAQGNVDPNTGLPKVSDQGGWIRTPQSFPVRLILDGERPKGIRYGAQANVVIYTGDNPVTNALGALWMRIISVLTYVS